MRQLGVTIVALLLLGAFFKPGICRAAQDASPVQNSSASDYPDSEAGLKKQLEDIFTAVAAKDKSKMSLYFSGLKIPDHGAWFAKTFGPEEGARLEAKYAGMLPGETKQVKEKFDNAVKGQWTIVVVYAYHKPEEIAGLWRAVMQAMTQPTTLYSADGQNPNQKFGFALGDFVYVDGGFRYVDTQVWQALSSAPPLRIRIGGDVASRSLSRRVDPIYPAEARAAHTEGTVRLHLVIALDGTVKEMTLVQGDPVLSKAAMEAVRQWQYKPTLLNGKAVEVDTTVDVIFSRR